MRFWLVLAVGISALSGSFPAGISPAACAAERKDPSGAAASETPASMTRAELREQGFRPLFAGKDLSHWDVQTGHQGHWRATDQGVIEYDGQAEQQSGRDKSLWTQESFGDVQLYVEWRFTSEPKMKPHPIVLWNGDFLRDERGRRITRPRPDAGDSGILFRGTTKCQANIWCQEMGSGEINGYRTDQSLPVLVRRSCIPFINADRPPGQWNAFLITLRDRMCVRLNGQVVLRSEPLPGLPARGPIGLQHHGDPIEFRNIWVKELTGND